MATVVADDKEFDVGRGPFEVVPTLLPLTALVLAAVEPSKQCHPAIRI